MLPIYQAILDDEKDKDKFELLYTTYRKLMFYVANRILQDEGHAEEAVHQAFLKILECFDKVGDISCHKTKSFVVTIVRNNAINIYNRRKRYPTISFEDLEFCLSEEPVEQADEFDDLTKAILKLPVIYQDVLTLKYVQEFSNKEIAKILNISETTVRKRLERARCKLERILKKEVDTDVN